MTLETITKVRFLPQLTAGFAGDKKEISICGAYGVAI